MTRQGLGDRVIGRTGDRKIMRTIQQRDTANAGSAGLLPACGYSAATLLLTTALIFLSSASALAQQIGNPTLQNRVSIPRGTFVIRNAHIVTVSGADIDNGSIVIRD